MLPFEGCGCAGRRSHAATRPGCRFKKLLAANRGEIAIRVFRAATELGMRSVAIYSPADRLAQHRYKADESYCVGEKTTPVGAYLDYEGIIATAKANGVDAIHPGYGFLSENSEFARRCEEEGIQFVGPTAATLRDMGDKTRARALAVQCGLPVCPGSDDAVSDAAEAAEYIDKIGYPVILKAAMGGGGRGMRVVRTAAELSESFLRASSEAKAAFGDGRMFVERYVQAPRHIEVQILADHHGNVVHLGERDCSVQRRHQKARCAAIGSLIKRGHL
jgi:pyruvate carboxylase